ncbi:Queuosine salvage protein [Mycena kentingensis (nom. inval.)]|nr:Queuosine salvage protein [Mycena kentingensis (nom. inval.)]
MTSSELPLSVDAFLEKSELYLEDASDSVNPVVEGADFAYNTTNIVRVNDDGVRLAAQHIRSKMRSETYSPRTWRTHPLHICPPDPYVPNAALTKTCLDWIFLISALNFSFWSEHEGTQGRFGVSWFESWEQPAGTNRQEKVWTGYWSSVAALNRALQDDIPITDPAFYSSETLCPDSLIEHVFRPADGCVELVPLLPQRIAVMREVGFILCQAFGGSYQTFLDEFQREHDGNGTALQLVHRVTDTFPSFRDEVFFQGRRVCLWKRAQILVAETWAAFYPENALSPHPLFPGSAGPAIHQLTMFADYRVPQILHHLRILSYPQTLVAKLHAGTPLESGCAEELSLRAASIVAVERVRKEMQLLATVESAKTTMEEDKATEDAVSSVLIDFYLWDLAKRVERGEERIEGLDTADMVPTHRTRSIWY